jgi:hypothetical protein
MEPLLVRWVLPSVPKMPVFPLNWQRQPKD